MSYRSKRTRLGIASKSKEIKDRLVEAVVAEVVHDVGPREADNDETLRSICYNQSTDQALDQRTQASYTDANDVISNMVKSSERESPGPSLSQPSMENLNVAEQKMSYTSKRTRLGIASKSKESKNRSVEAVVAEVVHDVDAREADDDETLCSSCYNQSTDQAMDQPTQATYTDANDVRSNLVKSSGRESRGPSPSEPSMKNFNTSEHKMNYWSKRTRLGIASKSKEIKDLSVEGVEVVRDVAAREADDDETLHSSCYNQSTDQVMEQPSQATYTDANDVRSNMAKSSGRESIGPFPAQPSATDPSSEFKSSRRHNSVKINSSVAPSGAQALETDLSLSHNIWMDDPSMSELRQVKTMEVNNGRPNKRSVADRQFHPPPPNQLHPDDSPSQLRASKRQSFWVHEDVEEPSDRGRPRGRRSKIANWTDDLEFDEMEEVEMRDSEGRRGKKGGSILPRHVWSLQSGVRFVVPVNALDQPVRKGGHVLVKFLGDVAKNGEFCPVGEVNWHKVDKSCKANIINLIRDKFVLPAREEIDKSILKHVARKWRSYRHELKVQYKKPDKTQEEIASVVPKGVSASQWERLVQYWFSEKSQFLSAKGKEARALQTHLHTAGGKSFARMRDEFERAHGREPGALEWFAHTHVRKDGTFLDDSSKEFLDAATAMVAQRGSTSSPTKRIAIENQVFKELMYSDDDKCYWPIGYGFGANRKKIFGVGGELRKRGYMYSDASGHATRNKLSGIDAKPKRHDYSALDTVKEVDRLSFAMAAFSETNEQMQVQIQKQSKLLKKQAQQLQMQSEQMEGLQTQLRQVTSLLTKFGVMLNNPQNGPTCRGTSRQGFNVSNAQVPEASSEYTDSDSDNIEWESD